MSWPEGAVPLGVFGGTFDPVHIGHLRLAEEARLALGLGTVRWVPAGQPPLRATPQTLAAARLAMVARAIAGNPSFALDDAEVRTPQASYTVHTLERLRAELGAAQPLVLLMGADAFARLEAWFDWRRLFALAHIGLATRPGHPGPQVDAGSTATGNSRSIAPRPLPGRGSAMTSPDEKGGTMSTALEQEFRRRQADVQALRSAPAGAIVPFALTPLDISATGIRAQLAQGQSVRYLVSEPVLDYIQQHNLYR